MPAPASRGQWIELRGPLFDPATAGRFRQAVGEGLRELAEEGVEILQGYIHQARFIDSGRFVTSIQAEWHSPSRGGSGYAVVRPESGAVYPRRGRPTRTWYERGTRAGVKRRPASHGFRKTKARLRAVSVEGVFDRIRGLLN